MSITSSEWLDYITRVTRSSLPQNVKLALIALVTDIGEENDATKQISKDLLEIERVRAQDPKIANPTPTIGDLERRYLTARSMEAGTPIVCYGRNKFKWNY